jgi:hypothetical protein
MTMVPWRSVVERLAPGSDPVADLVAYWPTLIGASPISRG